ncbi:hypothetical protein AAFF_G00249160 [Aldrovandia affinis]|uniref:Ubiquitin thioesterase OTU n=1 Tax=Aldrovandia affinis TaxID=143900 RepID=A0AAD7RDR5_9TELE|nr:hypothetical protein AAFF_G00249160 [Aldrovandia affinis]
MLRLRCKAKNGTHMMQGLTHQSCVQELKSKVEELTGIPCNVQKIMVGYPPSSLDLSSGGSLKDYPIKSGDTLIVEEEKNKPVPQAKAAVTKDQVPAVPRLHSSPALARRVVPADNSCLFTSVSYVVEGGVYDPACAPEMRGLIAQIVASDPTSYSEAVLGKTNEDYCAWIRRDDTWGGAIEVSILSKFYRCEICVVDTQTVRVDRFGEDAGYRKRVLLIYDGIHYDPLQREAPGRTRRRRPSSPRPTTSSWPRRWSWRTRRGGSGSSRTSTASRCAAWCAKPAWLGRPRHAITPRRRGTLTLERCERFPPAPTFP